MLAYADQDRNLDPDKTVWEVISDGKDMIPSARGKSIRGPTSPGSISRERISRRSCPCYPGASGTAFTSPAC